MFHPSKSAGGKGKNFIGNLSIRSKLAVGFGVILICLFVSVAISMASILNIGRQVDLYGKYTLPNATYTLELRRNMLSVQANLLQAMIDDDQGQVGRYLDKAQEDAAEAQKALTAFTGNQRSDAQKKEIASITSALEKATSAQQQISDLLSSGAADNRNKAYRLYTDEYVPNFNTIAETGAALNKIGDQRAAAQKTEAQNAKALAWILAISSTAVSLVLTVVIISAIGKSILNPIDEIGKAYEEISKGNIEVEITYDGRDELGRMARLIKKANEVQGTVLRDVIEKFTRISQGDMDIKVDLDYPGAFAALKQAIEKTVSSLSRTLFAINTAAEQVSTGAGQVSSGAQALASGATEQAATVEELNASVAQVAGNAEKNLEHVKAATEFSQQAGEGIKAGNERMNELTKAMTNIDSASSQIANITKAVQDIAFQTNILALNAAVEAARAGDAGKGFAVVADEVRNLATKSAEAAKETAQLIDSSASAVARGSQITAQTAQILTDVQKKAITASESISKIEQASFEQTSSIEQIRQGLSQVSSVVQTNAATAEENSATSEEMSAQAAALREEVAKFNLNSKEIRAAG
ncbi:Methyl-accepting chemotaxis protein [Ruminococcaceae bacterium BL-6]|nr:Methyl-accepting chemotaxis protein [Ruminococcaceae bacterium BL-6]